MLSIIFINVRNAYGLKSEPVRPWTVVKALSKSNFGLFDGIRQFLEPS